MESKIFEINNGHKKPAYNPFLMPAFPQMEILGHNNITGQPEVLSHTGINLLDYYLTHAPDCPTWFKDLETDQNESDIKELADDDNRQLSPITDMEIEIKWRYVYAKNMILHRQEFLRSGSVIPNPDILEY